MRNLLLPLLLLSALVSYAEETKRAQAAFALVKWTHSSGVEVYHYPIAGLPIIDLSIILDAGSVRASAGKEGISSLTASLLDAGTESMDENAFAERLAFTGAQIDADSDRDKMVISLRTLSDEKPKGDALALFAEMVRSPAFPEEVLQREAKRSIANLKQSLTEPGTIVQRRFRASLFAGHPYGRLATEESLAGITREDIVRHYVESLALSRMKFAFVGDIGREEADDIVSRITDGLAKGEPPPPLGDASEPAEAAVQHVAHPSAQSHIMIGQLGLKRNDPDYFKLHLGAEVLGGGMASRLFEEVRIKRGLAYSVYSHFSPTKARGEFVMSAQTSNERREEALSIMRETLARFLDEGPTEQELLRAKESWNKGFALRLDSNRKIMGYVEVIAYYGLPLDYPGYAQSEIAHISPEDVRDAFRRRIDMDRLVQVVVGA